VLQPRVTFADLQQATAQTADTTQQLPSFHVGLGGGIVPESAQIQKPPFFGNLANVRNDSVAPTQGSPFVPATGVCGNLAKTLKCAALACVIAGVAMYLRRKYILPLIANWRSGSSRGVATSAKQLRSEILESSEDDSDGADAELLRTRRKRAAAASRATPAIQKKPLGQGRTALAAHMRAQNSERSHASPSSASDSADGHAKTPQAIPSKRAELEPQLRQRGGGGAPKVDLRSVQFSEAETEKFDESDEIDINERQSQAEFFESTESDPNFVPI